MWVGERRSTREAVELASALARHESTQSRAKPPERPRFGQLCAKRGEKLRQTPGGTARVGCENQCQLSIRNRWKPVLGGQREVIRSQPGLRKDADPEPRRDRGLDPGKIRTGVGYAPAATPRFQRVDGPVAILAPLGEDGQGHRIRLP